MRVVSARLAKSGNQGSLSNGDNKITGWSATFDDLNGWDSANNRYVFQTPGKYRVTLNEYITGASTTIGGGYRVNGGSTVYVTTFIVVSGAADRVNGSDLITVKAGDYIEPYAYLASASGGQVNATATYMTIEKISGPSQIAASEVVTFKVAKSTAQTLSSGVVTQITGWGTPSKDSHGGWVSASSRYVCQMAGTYEVVATGFFGVNGTGTREFQVFKNGVFAAMLCYNSNPGAGWASGLFGVPAQVECVAGDYLDVRALQSSGGNLDFGGNADYVRLEIKRIGGVM
jgi:hypothetical protein